MSPANRHSPNKSKDAPGGEQPLPISTPNSVPGSERLFNLFLAALLLSYGAFGFYTNRIDITHKGQAIALLRGGSAWLMSAAMFVGAMILISVVVDHYDRRNNESSYKRFKWFTVRLGLCLVAASLLSHLYIVLFK